MVIFSANKISMSDRWRYIAAGVFFKIALDISYATYLTDAFANHFLTPFVINFSIFQYLESFIWLALVLLFVPFSSRSAGGLAFFSGIVFLYAPVASIYGMDDDRSRYTLFLSALAIGSAYLVSATSSMRKVKIALPNNGRKYLLTLSIFFAVLFLLNAAISGALFGMNFDIGRVYEFRSDLTDTVDIGLFAYTNLWAQKVFTPLILAIGLQRKSAWMIGLALALHVIYFGVSQQRSHLFTPSLVLIAYLLYRKEFSYKDGFVLLGIILLVLNLVVLALNLEVFGALAIRRSLFVGASATYSWVNYFAENPKVFFADNLLSPVVSNEYTRVFLPRLVGDFLRSDMDINFNSGLVGAGFAQLGVVGVVVYGSIIGAFIRINRRLIEAGVHPYIPAAILFLPYRVAWADADLLTALLSHGIIVGTFAVWLFGSSRNLASMGSSTIKQPARV